MNAENRQQHRRQSQLHCRPFTTVQMKLRFYRNHRGSKVVEGGDGSVTRPDVRFDPIEGKEYGCLVTTVKGSKYSHATPTITAGLTDEEWMSDAELRKPLDLELRFTKTDRGNFRAFLTTGQLAQTEPGFTPMLNETRSYRCQITRDGSGVIAKAFSPAVEVPEAKTTLGETISQDQQNQLGFVTYRGQTRNVFEILGVRNPKAPEGVIVACANTLHKQLLDDFERCRNVSDAKREILKAIEELKTVKRVALEVRRANAGRSGEAKPRPEAKQDGRAVQKTYAITCKTCKKPGELKFEPKPGKDYGCASCHQASRTAKPATEPKPIETPKAEVKAAEPEPKPVEIDDPHIWACSRCKKGVRIDGNVKVLREDVVCLDCLTDDEKREAGITAAVEPVVAPGIAKLNARRDAAAKKAAGAKQPKKAKKQQDKEPAAVKNFADLGKLVKS